MAAKATDVDRVIGDVSKVFIDYFEANPLPPGVRWDMNLERGVHRAEIDGQPFHAPNGTATFTIRINGGAGDTPRN